VAAVWFGTGHLPRTDDFSFTAAGAPWVDHEWLSGVVFYGLLRAGGEPALQLFKYAAAAAALGLVLAVHRAAYRVSPLWGAYTLSLLAVAYLAAYVSTLRAQVFSIAGFLACLALLERVRLRQWPRVRLCWLLPIAAVWGNLHGGFVMAMLAVLLYAVGAALLGRRGESALHVALALGMLAAVAFLNPYGPRYLAFLLHAWSLERTGIREWEPMLAGPWSAGSVLLACVAALGAALALRTFVGAWRQGAAWPRRTSPASANAAFAPLAPALVLLLVIAMALLARRIHSFMSLGFALYLPVLAAPLGRAARLPRWAVRAAGVGVPIAAGLAAAVLLAGPLRGRPILHSLVPDESSRVELRYRFPVGAVRYLREAPVGGRLLNPFTPGEFLYWALYPKFRIAIDGRYEEVYAQAQFLWVSLFYAERDPARIVRLAADSTADFVLLRSGTPGLAALAANAEWRTVYDDGVWALAGRRALVDRPPAFRFERRPPGPAPTIASYFTPADRSRFASYPE
jgi:hypothetical protein